MPRYPHIDPFAQGMLDVGEGHQIYWETSGNPRGKPALLLHGGPGSGSSPASRRRFDPEAYLVVAFDQRGCGRSTPPASDPATDLSTNTTHHLIADIERLREHLGVDRWQVHGGSWGVTLALAYAERHPARVSEMVLASVTLTRRTDVRWLTHELGRFFPEPWRRFRAGASAADRDGDLVGAYHRLLNETDELSVREQAAHDWCAWEDALVSNEAGWTPDPRYDDPAFRLGFARLVTHYFHHAAWLEDDELLRGAHRLTGIPGVLVHGRYDLGGPADVPWLLARAWPDAELHLVDTGHRGGQQMTQRVLDATERFKTNAREGLR